MRLLTKIKENTRDIMILISQIKIKIRNKKLKQESETKKDPTEVMPGVKGHKEVDCTAKMTPMLDQSEE